MIDTCCLEKRLLGGLLMGGSSVKYGIEIRISPADFLTPVYDYAYWLIMAIPPAEDDKSRQRFRDDLTAYLHRHCKMMAEARAWADHETLVLIDSCDTTDPQALAEIADTLRRWSVSREFGISEWLHMLLADGEMTYREIRSPAEADGWTKAEIDAALRFERGRGLKCRSEGGKSRWTITEEANP